MGAHDDQIAAWTAAGLLGADSVDDTGRIELLGWLAERGATVEQMVRADADGQLDALAGDLVLRPGRLLSLREVAARVGLEVDSTVEIRRASGLPPVDLDDPVHPEDDLAMFQVFADASALFSTAELLHITRVMGSSMRRIAEAASEMFLRDVEGPLHRQDHRPLDHAQASLAGTFMAIRATEVFHGMFLAHLDAAVRGMRRARAGLHTYDSVPLTVGFVDLTEYTAAADVASPGELLELITRFESTSSDVVTEHGGRLVKLIGDEVMFSTVDAESGCAIARAIVEAAHAWGVEARGGVASGPVVTAGGDLYGTTVNRAARICDTAVPGEVLVDATTHQQAGRHRTEAAGRRMLKGFTNPAQVWSLVW